MDKDDLLLNLLIESWRFLQASKRASLSLDATQIRSYQGQIRWFERKMDEVLEETGWKLLSFEHHPYDPGLPLKALNMADFGANEQLVIDRMLEPAVTDSNGLVKMGTVLLRKA